MKSVWDSTVPISCVGSTDLEH